MAGLTDQELAQAFEARRQGNASERLDAKGQIFTHFQDSSMQRQFLDVLPKNMQESQGMLDQINKAITYGNRRNFGIPNGSIAGTGSRSSVPFNPFDNMGEVAGTRTKRFKVPGNLLREMVVQDPLLVAILMNFKNRSVSHTKPIQRGFGTAYGQVKGFDIVHRYKQVWEKLDPDEEQERQAIMQFLADSGDSPRFRYDGLPNREDLERDSFSQFMSKLVHDRFVLDAVAIELVKTRNGKNLSGYYAVDGDKIFRTSYKDWPYGDVNGSIPTGAAFAEIMQGQVVTTFGTEDLYYDYANARTDIRSGGYGISEVEMSVRLTTGILNVISNNNSLFDRNSIPEVLLFIKGQINREALLDFEQGYDAFRMGAAGSNGLPVVTMRDEHADIKAIPMGKGSKEMEFAKYMNFLMATRSAIFGVDVMELNGTPFGSGGSSGLGGSEKGATTKMEESKDRGWLPWMIMSENIINNVIHPLLKDKWMFIWTGLNKKDGEMYTSSFLKTHTVDQVRMAIHGSEPLGGIQGSVLADNAAISQMITNAVSQGANVGGNLEEEMGDSNSSTDNDTKQNPNPMKKQGKVSVPVKADPKPATKPVTPKK